MTFPEPTDAELEQVASELRTIAHTSQWNRVLAIGRLIFVRFFNGDERAWQERRRNKNLSIRKLAERPDCPFAKSALTEAVGIHVLCSKYPDVCNSARLSPTHVGRTLGLPLADAIELLHRADRESWSVRQIGAEATRLRRSQGERRGRPASHMHHRTEACGKRAISSLKEMHQHLADAPPLDAITLERFRSIFPAIEQALSAIRNLLLPEGADRRQTSPPGAPSDGFERRRASG